MSGSKINNAAGLVLAAVVMSAAAAPAGPGDVGTVAAPFSLAELGGGTRSLDQHRDQVVFLAVIGYG